MTNDEIAKSVANRTALCECKHVLSVHNPGHESYCKAVDCGCQRFWNNADVMVRKAKR